LQSVVKGGVGFMRVVESSGRVGVDELELSGLIHGVAFVRVWRTSPDSGD
jgi:hypothetical protein